MIMGSIRKKERSDLRTSQEAYWAKFGNYLATEMKEGKE